MYNCLFPEVRREHQFRYAGAIDTNAYPTSHTLLSYTIRCTIELYRCARETDSNEAKKTHKGQQSHQTLWKQELSKNTPLLKNLPLAALGQYQNTALLHTFVSVLLAGIGLSDLTSIFVARCSSPVSIPVEEM